MKTDGNNDGKTKKTTIGCARAALVATGDETSDALDLDKGVFSLGSPRAIARSLKRSAERSRRRKSGSLRSAMSMLTFYINRAGRKLSKTRRARLESAKKELRLLYRR